MSRRVRRVPYQLDTRDVKDLPLEEITAILRGADDLIMSGGRSLSGSEREFEQRQP
jgi:hypothetical protein